MSSSAAVGSGTPRSTVSSEVGADDLPF